MIKERYCSYEVAMLLKEKGFDELCENIYFDKGLMDFVPDMFDDERWIKNSDFPNSYLVDATAPTHQMAIDWLGDIYDLYIIVYPYKRGNSKGWCCYIYKTYNLLGQEKYINETCNSCYEAIEAALKYALKNLI